MIKVKLGNGQTKEIKSEKEKFNGDAMKQIIMETKASLIEDELESLKQQLIDGGVING